MNSRPLLVAHAVLLGSCRTLGAFWAFGQLLGPPPGRISPGLAWPSCLPVELWTACSSIRGHACAQLLGSKLAFRCAEFYFCQSFATDTIDIHERQARKALGHHSGARPTSPVRLDVPFCAQCHRPLQGTQQCLATGSHLAG